MKRLLMFVSLICLATAAVAAPAATFTKTKIVDDKQKQVQAALSFDPATRTVVLKNDTRTFAEIPYAAISNVTYEPKQRRRVKEGALVMIGSLGIGGVVMLTKSTNHWMKVDYVENGVSKELILRLDKKEYGPVRDAFQSETGKVVATGRAAPTKR